MSEFKIESGVPAPSNCGIGRPCKYPFSAMKVGDSFAVPIDEQRTLPRKLGTAASSYARYNPPLKFATRTVGDEVRCWRIA